jgi:cytochrome b6-f complex iron-sulfur subunit
MDTQNPAGTNSSEMEGIMGRRDFLNGVAVTALAVAAVGAAVVTIEYLSPNVLFEPPTSFRIGTPENYPVSSVTYFPEQQVYVVRIPAGFTALSAVCTHLGCITQWNPGLERITCPCHGSRFTKDGAIEHGPAPRPLQRFAIRLMPDGNLMVDKLETAPQNEVLKV